MGIFSQDKTSTNQTSINQQQGISTRDVTGAQLTSGGGSVSSFGTAGLSVGGGGSSAIYTSGGASIGGGGSSGNTITVNNSLDATALDTAASLVNSALTSNSQLAQSALTAFQGATTVQAETAQPAGAGVATPLSGDTGPPIASGGFAVNTTDLILLGAAAVVVGLILYGRHR